MLRSSKAKWESMIAVSPSSSPTRRARWPSSTARVAVLDEVLDTREDARHEVMVLDELVEHRAEVGSLDAQRGEESVVLAGVVGLQGPAEAETVLEDAGGRGLRVDRRRPRSDETVTDQAHPCPQVVVHGGQLGGQRRRAVVVVMTGVAEARGHGAPSPSRGWSATPST